LATDDIATEVGRLRDQPGEGVVSIGGAGLRLTESRILSSRVVYLRYQRIR
jgi:hypothetical protein